MEWEITADDAQYYEKQSEIVVRAPRVTIYTEAGQPQAWLTGDEGRLGLAAQGRELGSVELTRRRRPLARRPRAAHRAATYDRPRDLITAPGPVTITGRDDGRKRATAWRSTSRRSSMRLLDDVHTVLEVACRGGPSACRLAVADRPRQPPRNPPGRRRRTRAAGAGPFGFGGLGKSKEPINVTSDNLEYDYKANIVVYRGAVEVIQGDVEAHQRHAHASRS